MTLATLLERHRVEIATAWAARIRALPGNRYGDWSAENVLAWACRALDAIIEGRKTGSSRALEAHAAALGEIRAEQHFEIDQVIEGLLRLYEEAIPYILRASPDLDLRAIGAARDLHAALRLMAAEFAKRFAQSMREQREQVAVLEERTRLARDLHDSVSQSLYGVGMYAEAAARLLEGGKSEAAAGCLREVRDSASEALREMRFLIFELRPSVLREEGLIGALKARLAAVEHRAGIRARLVAEAEGERLPWTVEEALYGIAREALNNALRHARSTEVAIRFDRGEGTATLTICDNGAGFDPEAAERKGGLGLRGMRERAARIDARLTVASRAGEGTQVTVALPLPLSADSVAERGRS